MLVDYVIAASAAVMVASVVIMVSLLSRYRDMVKEADRSTRLAKDVWDSLNSRFAVVDSRIIDLMAKTEVLSTRSGDKASSHSRPSLVSKVAAPLASEAVTPKAAPIASSATIGNTETESRVLRMLVSGPKSSAQIKDELGRSREHTARLMKGLFDRGLVVRNDTSKPYVYEITDSGRSYLAN